MNNRGCHPPSPRTLRKHAEQNKPNNPITPLPLCAEHEGLLRSETKAPTPRASSSCPRGERRRGEKRTRAALTSSRAPNADAEDANYRAPVIGAAA
ncbi:hypothetical protein AAFF_G00250570 [Aldrovandia affinis]|uniref:Uncharacterized protein n=1 Tax=Aldrovandia affinis TaxID=143900 RepID=A0AAD7RD64_9TELE|nr:hypothetical protein AAFF_G00250570 [Aldrovandia affinis]